MALIGFAFAYLIAAIAGMAVAVYGFGVSEKALGGPSGTLITYSVVSVIAAAISTLCFGISAAIRRRRIESKPALYIGAGTAAVTLAFICLGFRLFGSISIESMLILIGAFGAIAPGASSRVGV